MEILTSVKRLYIRFKSLVNDFVYSFGRAALLLLVEVYNHTVPVQERRRIRVKLQMGAQASACEVHRYCPLMVSDFDRKRDRSINCILISQYKML